MSVQGIWLSVSAVIAAALLGAMGGWLAVSDAVNAQSALPAPNNLAVNHGTGPGNVVVSWDAVAGASSYSVGWMNLGAARRTIAAGGPWQNGIQSVDVADSGTETQT